MERERGKGAEQEESKFDTVEYNEWLVGLLLQRRREEGEKRKVIK